MPRFTKQQIKDMMKATGQLIEQDGETGEKFLAFSENMMLARWSRRNLMLIFSQCPDATNVAGYKQWQQAGRQVRKGEQGIAIWCPIEFHPKDEQGNRKEDETELGFRIGYVFDISQTETLEIDAPLTAGATC